MTSEFSDPFKQIRDQVKGFDPCDLLYYITLLGALPENEIKCVRLETLFKIVISTRQRKFKNYEFDEEVTKKLLNDLGSLPDWYAYEDFDPTPLFDYPEMWVLGKKYNIFSGSEDRSYEYWKELVLDYFPIREAFLVKGYDPVDVIKDVLSLQTTLVSLIRQHKDDICKVGDMSFPSSELFESWKCTINDWYQNSPNRDFYEQHSVKLGRNIDHAHMIELEPLETMCKFFSIRFTHNAVPIFQHNIFSFLNILFLRDFKDLKNQKPSLSYDTSDMLYRCLSKLFQTGDIIPHFSIGNSGEVDFAVVFDNDKLFLFKILHCDFVHDFQKHQDESVNILKKINRAVSLGKRDFNIRGSNAGTLCDRNYETISIVLIKSVSSVSGKISKKDHLSNHIIFPIGFLDFLSMANDIKDGMRFLKFLRYHREIQDTMSVIFFGILDVYAHYALQNDCFLFSGNTVNLLAISPGTCAKYYIKKLKGMPGFQLRSDDREPDDSWDVIAIPTAFGTARGNGVHSSTWFPC